MIHICRKLSEIPSALPRQNILFIGQWVVDTGMGMRIVRTIVLTIVLTRVLYVPLVRLVPMVLTLVPVLSLVRTVLLVVWRSDYHTLRENISSNVL